MNTWRNASLAVTAAAVLALTTACGQEKGTETPNGRRSARPTRPSPAAAATARTTAAGAGTAGPGGGAKPAGQLAVWDSKELGKVVTDSAGFTLYRFDKDTAEPAEVELRRRLREGLAAVCRRRRLGRARHRRRAARRGHPGRRHQAADRRRLADVPLRQGHQAR